MPRYWLYIGSKIQGPIDVAGLRKVGGFNLLTQVCQEGEQTWRLADEVIEIKSYFLAPPRASAFPMTEGNTALKVEPEAVAVTDTSPLEILHSDDGLVEELPPIPREGLSQKKPEGENPAKDSTVTPSAKGGVLRAVCEVCGFKNPRDVNACMKCGTPIKAGLAEPAPAAETPLPVIPPVKEESSAPETPVLEHVIVPPSPLRGLLPVAAILMLIVGGLLGYRSWKKKQTQKEHAATLARAQADAAAQAAKAERAAARKAAHALRSSSPYYSSSRPAAHTLPGVRDPQSAQRQTSIEEEGEKVPRSAESPQRPAYRVIAEATPLKYRTSSPIDSPYAQKRRSDKTLWTAQQEQAIRQVQRTRIYGGQRTMQRNVDILLQLLRDKEYMSAFESGKRPYLYNDLDWSASIQEAPVYEVRLTLSGGREEDGSPRKPLRFAFNVDLERGTVEPGGEDSSRSNTLHAFFDESRIPPEERRPIAKDVEELVMAADPAASPLALDTVVRNFSATYSVAALERVANAFQLDAVKKKIKHDPRLGKAFVSSEAKATAAEAESGERHQAKSSAGVNLTSTGASLPMDKLTLREEEKKATRPVAAPVKEIAGDFQMQAGSGRDRIVQARVSSKASPERLWEALTSYDRFKQFVPDVLDCSREGQDGAAVIVHAVTLARWMMLVFKINLHLRILERPAQKIIEFERIAGDFQTFRGSFEIQTDPQTKVSTLRFSATLAPKGKMPDWVLRAMSKRFIMPKLDAFRQRAETN